MARDVCAGKPSEVNTRTRLVGARLVLLAVIVVTTVYAARANNNGVDFTNNVWGPARGLLSGRNPYEPANSSYLRRYDLSLVGGLYTPSVLVLHLPLVALSKSRASDVIAVLDALLVWAGVLLLVRPRSSAGFLVATLLGALLVASATVQDSVAFGQIAPWAFFGFALLVRTIDAPVSPWWPALGVVLISLKPQSMLPLFVVLAFLAAWGVMLRALALLAATSLPGLALLLHAAGSPAAVGRTVRDNLRYFAHIPEDDLHNRSTTESTSLACSLTSTDQFSPGSAGTWPCSYGNDRPRAPARRVTRAAHTSGAH